MNQQFRLSRLCCNPCGSLRQGKCDRKDAVRLILKIIIVTAVSVIIGLLLHKRMKKQWLRTNKTVALLLSAVMAIALSIRFGLSVYISGAVSVLSAPVCLGVGSDRQVGCRSPQCLGIGTLADQCSDSRNHLHAGIGGAVSFAIQTGVSVFSGGRYGGADIKISLRLCFLLGWSRGLIGLALGLLTGVLFTLIYNKIKNAAAVKALLSCRLFRLA